MMLCGYYHPHQPQPPQYLDKADLIWIKLTFGIPWMIRIEGLAYCQTVSKDRKMAIPGAN